MVSPSLSAKHSYRHDQRPTVSVTSKIVPPALRLSPLLHFCKVSQRDILAEPDCRITDCKTAIQEPLIGECGKKAWIFLVSLNCLVDTTLIVGGLPKVFAFSDDCPSPRTQSVFVSHPPKDAHADNADNKQNNYDGDDEYRFQPSRHGRPPGLEDFYFRYLFSQSSTVLYHSFEFCGFSIQ